MTVPEQRVLSSATLVQTYNTDNVSGIVPFIKETKMLTGSFFCCQQIKNRQFSHSVNCILSNINECLRKSNPIYSTFVDYIIINILHCCTPIIQLKGGNTLCLH